MALGARPGDAVRMVLARVAFLVGVGGALGGAVAWWASALVGSLLYGMGPRDAVTLVGAFGLLAAVALLAGWVPAARAARTHPGVALRGG